MKISLDTIERTKVKAGKDSDSGIFDFLNRDIKFVNSQFSDKKKERFYSELSILFSAGVDIRSSLELIQEEQTKEKDKALFEGIKDAVVSGAGLSLAMQRSSMFSDYEIFSLQIGEESGRLTEVLGELSAFFEKKINQKRQLSKAMSYPIVVFAASFGALFFMMKFVVPMFSDVFKRFKGELPYFTRVIIHVSDFFSNYSMYLFLCLILIVVLLYRQRRKAWFRSYGAALVLRIPVVKEMVAKIYLARFCQSMNLLISARTPLVTALELVQRMVGFYPLEKSLTVVREDIMKGESLHKSLSKFSIYNKRMISLIKVAEEVNQLDTMFGRMARQYSDEVEHQTSVLGSLIEPLMIIFLGALVAIILVAMYLPMFQMSSAVG
jgi:type IV pilus assembly protein PilC